METINYIKEYFKAKEHDLTSLISGSSINNDDKIKEIKKQINKLQKDLELKTDELHKEVENVYTNNFVPLSSKVVIKYDGRINDVYFDLATGLALDELQGDEVVYTTYTKSDTLCVVVGYSFQLASIVVKEYKYNINRDNTRINLSLLEESAISFFEDKQAVFVVDKEETTIKDNIDWSVLRSIQRVDGKEFINTLFGVNYEGSLDLEELRRRYAVNKSFEIILKTSPKEIVDDLLELEVDKPLPINKIIGVSQETYNKAIERGNIKMLFDNRNFINGKNNEKYNLHKTENEWFELIDEMKHYEEDLRFYNIDFYRSGYYNRNNNLLTTILTDYTQEQVFKDNYSFGKFANYVINETINQGYNSINDFVIELRDYLNMCTMDDIKPTLYSSYLKQTHDITSRNHKVIVEKEKEKIFTSRYKDFKEYKGKMYYVVAPKNSDDLKREGDRLNHCVASYIKRVIDGECLIYFLRTNKEESLITFEVRHNAIVQVRGLHNRKPTEKEKQALIDFAKCRKMEVDF